MGKTSDATIRENHQDGSERLSSPQIKKNAENQGKKERGYFIEFFAFALIGAFCILTVCYMDITVAPRFGVTLIDSLFDGELLSFYHLSNIAGINAEGANYDMGYFIIYGIWDFPVWVLHHLFQIDTGNTWCLIWYKIPLLFFTFITARETVQVAKLCGIMKDSEREVLLLFLTTSVLFFPVMIACQCDIISVAFAMGATRLMMENRYRSGLLLFAVSMTVKPFTILWLALCVAYQNRNLFKTIFDFACGCSLFLLSRGLYLLSPSHPGARQRALTEDPAALWSTTISVGNGEISLFFVVIVIVLIAAFANRESLLEISGRRKLLVYLYVLWGAFLVVVGIVPYWAVYFAPVSVLVMCMAGSEAAMLMDLAVNVAFTAIMIMRFTWVYGGSRTFSYLLLKRFFVDEKMASDGITVSGFLTTLHMHHFVPVLFAIVAGGVIYIGYSAWKKYPILGVIGYDKAQDRETPSGFDEDTVFYRSVRWEILLRLLFLYGFIALALAAMAATRIWKY